VVLALMRRDFAITRSYRFALWLDLGYAVIDLAFYYFISKTFEGVSTRDLAGAPSYFAFVTVGLAVTVVIGSTSAQLAMRIREEQLTGTLEALVAQPMSPTELAVGLGALPFVSSMLRAGFYLVVATTLLGADFADADWLGFVTVLLVTGAALSGLGVAIGAVVLVVKRGVTTVSLVTFAMGILGGAFFPVSVLPDWLEPLSYLVPTRYAFDGLRAALFEGSGWGGDALVLAGLAAVALPASVWLFAAALRHSRRTGSLVQY
jgi:ABC-2 type transport system permease protein